MIDKLTVLSSSIQDHFADLAIDQGTPKAGYEKVLDLRSTDTALPARLYYRGRRTRIHKVEMIGVARLGWPRTREVLQEIFSNLDILRIYRIDLAVDLLGTDVDFFIRNCRVPRRQNIALYRSRGNYSFYPVFSRLKKLVVYDRLAKMRKDAEPMATIYLPGDCLTRIEAQLSGAEVPFTRLNHIRRYADFDPFKELLFKELHIQTMGLTAGEVLKAMGLRQSVQQYGLQDTLKQFAAQERAYIEKTFLTPMKDADIPPLKKIVQRSVGDWLAGRIRFPRGRAEEDEAA